MAQVLNLSSLVSTRSHSSSIRAESNRSPLRAIRASKTLQSWTSLQSKLKCNGRVSCLFSDNRKQDQAKKALENALGGKKDEFVKWDKEIKKREEVGGGGGGGGGGGWFGWGRWFNGDHFWPEAQQTILTLLGIIVMYLIIAKGELMLAFVLNPLLFALRGTRNGFTYVTSRILRVTSPNRYTDFDDNSKIEEVSSRASAKEKVMRKWGNE